MGTHIWNEDCPACGFYGMTVYADRDTYFGADCPVCGYRRWTQEEKPSEDKIELAKKILAQLNEEGDLDQALAEYDEDYILLVDKFGGE